MISVRVKGLDTVVRSFDRTKENIEEALTEGTEEAGDYLIEMIEDKFGHYQPGWEQLKPDTIRKEKKLGYGSNADKPLVMSGDMMFSFDKRTAVKTRKHVVHITSDDPKLEYHMYGAPRANVPKRDPIRPTIKEENQTAIDIIKDAVRRAIRG